MRLLNPPIRILLVLMCGVLLWLCATYGNASIFNLMKVKRNAEESMNTAKDVDVEKVTIAVYYEALCPDSRGFIMNEVKPTYEKIPDYVNIELIPYGKATTHIGPGGYEFKCQHGARECEANKIHACAIDIITNPSVQLHFIACMIDYNLWPIKIARTCAERLHLDVEPVLQCAKTTKGSELLAEYGKMTDALKPPVTYIPTITLNGDISNQEGISKNLFREVCKHFKTPPADCS